MKMIIAYLQPERLEAVQESLIESGIFAMTISQTQGCGQQRGMVGIRDELETDCRLRPKVRLEIAVHDELFERAMESIIHGARTYHLGDGMIFVYELADCMRIRTRVRGPAALEQKDIAKAGPGASRT